MIYKPREDSLLLQKYVKKYAKGLVLDIGTGSGIQAITAAKRKNVKKVIALDIQQEVIDYCNEKIKNNKIVFLRSDLFSDLELKITRQKFDTIIFNPPYLPEDARLRDLTIDGGKKGYEILGRFLNEVNNYLKPEGIVLIVFSSLTNKEIINRMILNNLLRYKELEKYHIFFEDLYVYLIKKSVLLKKLEKKGIYNLEYFTKGHRGLLFRADYKSKKAVKPKNVVIKIKNPKSKAENRIKNEVNFIKLLNKYNIAPRLLLNDKDYFIYEYVEGLFFPQFVKELLNKFGDKSRIITIIKNIFNQLYILDKLRIDKEEMHHPYKHIVINKNNKPVLLDFERCHKVKKPKNVTQFCQYLISKSTLRLLKNNNIDKNKIIDLTKKYKKSYDKKVIEKISNALFH
jgi:HemK-related putative methylase